MEEVWAVAAEESRARSRQRKRRQNTTGGRQGKTYKVTTTEAEDLALRVRAAELDVSVQRLLVESALAGGAETVTARYDRADDLFALRRALAGVANNLNQMTKAVNATGDLPPEVAPTLKYLRERLLPLLTDSIESVTRP